MTAEEILKRVEAMMSNEILEHLKFIQRAKEKGDVSERSLGFTQGALAALKEIKEQIESDREK